MSIDDRRWIAAGRGGTVAARSSPTSTAVAGGDACCPSVVAAPLTEDDAADLAGAFAALADPVRLRLLSMIASAGEVCSCDVVEPLGKSQPTVSHHTRVLAEAGLIVGDKRGRWVWWSAVPGRLEALRRALG
jgi:ArsR family transcriptional regulator, arsenate/arsenite/antimonite-responsive transcriptional repressor